MQQSWRRTRSSRLSAKVVPNMFYRIKVWRLSWPLDSLQTLTLKIILNKHSSMISGISIHQNEIIANCSSIWSNTGIKDLVTISHTNQISSMEQMQVSVTTERDSCPNHDSTTSKTVSFNNVGLVVSGALLFSDQYTP